MDLIKQAKQAKEAARKLATLSTKAKNEALKKIAQALLKREKEILKANQADLRAAEKKGMMTMFDRLALTPERLKTITQDVLNVAALEDEVGKIIDERVRPNGLIVQRVRCPLGVVGLIYESRPNVTVDAAVLCLKSGNAVMLKGGSEAINSNRVLVKIMKETLAQTKVPLEAIQFLDTTDRTAVSKFLGLKDYLDVIIPRGGKGLIDFVVENSKIPVIETGASVVHIYVDDEADFKKAIPVVVNAKTRRVSICNVLDVLLVNRKIAPKFLPQLAKALIKKSKEAHQPLVQIRADSQSFFLLKKKYPQLKKLNPKKDFDTEFLDYILTVKLVDNLEEALDHINIHSLKHSEAIITENKEKGEKFLKEVDAACCFLNTSTQFADGAQFGIGAEIGISTQKLHTRGPFALSGLTTFKWVVRGKGQIRP